MYDLSHARFTSKYVSFLSVDFISRDQHVIAAVPGVARTLFNKYVRLPGFPKWSDAVWHAALADDYSNMLLAASHRFPLVAVGGYGATGTNVAIPGDFMLPNGQGATFAQIQQSLKTGKVQGSDVERPPQALIQDFNAEANVITAFICHADGRKPASACNRKVIRSLLKRIK